MSSVLIEQLTEKIPELAKLAGADRDLMIANAQSIELPAGSRVFQTGAPCGAFVMVLDGSVRVQMIAENGREIVLYRVESGQTCILTTACLLANESYSAEAVTESPTSAVALPAGCFQTLLAQSQPFRDFVFSNYGQRISSLVLLVEEVAFRRIDTRLALFLVERQDADGDLKRTHNELAVELGSAREVISRQLKEFERRGWITLLRGHVKICNAGALENLRKEQCD